ncbi:hypothetical protein GCM10029992_06050 [Glycomyces albus]
MPDIVQAVARFGFLLLLWLFVFAAARTVTKDLLAQRRPAPPAVPARPDRSRPRPPPLAPAPARRPRSGWW